MIIKQTMLNDYEWRDEKNEKEYCKNTDLGLEHLKKGQYLLSNKHYVESKFKVLNIVKIVILGIDGWFSILLVVKWRNTETAKSYR